MLANKIAKPSLDRQGSPVSGPEAPEKRYQPHR